MNILFFVTPKANTVYVYEDNTLRQALQKLKHHGYTAVPVINRNGEYTGTLSEGDLLWSILEYSLFNDNAREQFHVRDILKSRQNKAVNVEAGIEDLIELSMNQNFVPVIDDRNVFIGLATRKDILNYYFHNKNKQH